MPFLLRNNFKTPQAMHAKKLFPQFSKCRVVPFALDGKRCVINGYLGKGNGSTPQAKVYYAENNHKLTLHPMCMYGRPPHYHYKKICTLSCVVQIKKKRRNLSRRLQVEFSFLKNRSCVEVRKYFFCDAEMFSTFNDPKLETIILHPPATRRKF